MNRIFYFSFGCVVGIVVGAIGVGIMMFEKKISGDFIKLFPAEGQGVIGGLPIWQWLRSAEARQIGLYNIAVPKNKHNASLMICSARKGHPYPRLMITDPNNQGIPQEIIIIGKGLEAGVSVTAGDEGKIRDLSLNANIGRTNMITRVDQDLDGIWDGISGPGDMLRMRIAQDMYEVVRSNGVTWAKTDNGLCPIIKDSNGNKTLDRGALTTGR